MKEDISTKLPAMERGGMCLTRSTPAHVYLGLVVPPPPPHSPESFISTPLPSLPHVFLANSKWPASTFASLTGFFSGPITCLGRAPGKPDVLNILAPRSPGVALEPAVVG